MGVFFLTPGLSNPDRNWERELGMGIWKKKVSLKIYKKFKYIYKTNNAVQSSVYTSKCGCIGDTFYRIYISYVQP